VSERAEQHHPRRLFRPRSAAGRRRLPGRQLGRWAAEAGAGVPVRGGRLRGAGDDLAARPPSQLVCWTAAMQRRVERRRLDAQLPRCRRLRPSRLPVHPQSVLYLTVCLKR